MSQKNGFQRTIVVLADGARPDVLAQELARGNLPNISRHLIEKGFFRPMTTVFPSTTGPAYLPYLTGCYPGTCNIPGIRWFDKPSYAKNGWSLKSFRSYCGLETFLFNSDIASKVKTSFEIFDKPVSIFNMVNRGIPNRGNLTKNSRIWYVYYAHLTDSWSFIDKAASKKLLSSVDDGFDFAFCVFPAIDEYAHRSSPFNERTIQAYRELDNHMGTLIDKLKAKGQYDDTLIVIVSDHGLSETQNHFDVGPWLEDVKGLKTFFYSNIFKFRFDASSMVSGNGMTHLYFKNKDGWGRRSTYEEMSASFEWFDELISHPSIDLACMQGADGSIHVLNDRGHGQFKLVDGIFEYQWKSNDPLGIFKTGNSQKFSEDDSYRLSFNSHFPDVFVQLMQVFSSPRCGDISLSAKTGHDLRIRFEHPEHKASHGSLCPEHMKVPLIVNYPLGLSDDAVIRSIDVFPTYMKLMNKTLDWKIDGRSLV